MSERRRDRGGGRRVLGRVFLLALAAFAALAAAVLVVERSLPDVAWLATGNPGETSVMRQRAAEARAAGRTPRRVQRWVPIGSVSPFLRRAVLVGEDASFYRHGGVDLTEMRAAAREDLKRRRVVRGGSTITQQLAKNLFLETNRTLTRKVAEILLALKMEKALPKRRILELYLNVIEWGDGIYGAEAAARHYFGVPASALTASQAALLAALIPSPRHDNPAARPRRLVRRYKNILHRLQQTGAIDRATYHSLRVAPYVLRGETPPAAPGVAAGDSALGAAAGGAGSPAPASSAVPDSTSPDSHSARP